VLETKDVARKGVRTNVVRPKVFRTEVAEPEKM
jgi:hypothetical protein